MTPLLNGGGFLSTYLDSNKNLIRTMVIKSESSVQKINEDIVRNYGKEAFNEGDFTTWKYYKNISGSYHPTDTIMTITSLDSLEEIIFSKENLAIHTATAAAYSYGSRYYFSLINRYPNQEQLIIGILYPADINEAIEAKDWTILSYPKHLIEPQEQTLIMELQEFIYRYKIRWDVTSFAVTDSLYNASVLALLYLALLPKLLNLRSKRCKTPEVHSFHIREYLSSNYKLDKYLPYMTLKQSLWLYRNIRYIQRNTGHVDLLKLLVEKILTDRQIPLAEYSVRQLSSFDENYYADISIRRKAVNTQFNNTEKDYVSTNVLFEKENRLVYGNSLHYKGAADKTNMSFKNSNSSVIQTKDLESNMVDYSNAVPDPLDRVLLRQWSHMTTHGIYNAVVNFKDPRNSETRTLYAYDALIYMSYIVSRKYGVDINELPGIFIKKFRLPHIPTLNQCLSKIDNYRGNLTSQITDIYDGQPNLVNCLSTEAFYNLSYKIYEEAQRHWFIISNTHDLYKRASIDSTVLSFYGDTYVDFAIDDNRTMDQWLFDKNLPQYDYNKLEADALISSIFNAATGYKVDDSKSLRSIQKNMLELLGALSSYTIQLIREVNDSDILPVNWAAIRTSPVLEIGYSNIPIKTNIDVMNAPGITKYKITYKHLYSQKTTIENSLCKQSYVVPSVLFMDYLCVDTRNIAVVTSNNYLSVSYPGYDSNIDTGMPGLEIYNTLTNIQKERIVSIYN